MRRSAWWALPWVLLAACGGARRSAPKSPSADAPEPHDAMSEHDAPVPAAPRDVPSAAPEDARAAPLDRAERELLVAAGDCASACRALGSMDRAAGAICRVSSRSVDCAQASERVRRARRRVADTCGACSAGPSVDPADPIPSAP